MAKLGRHVRGRTKVETPEQKWRSLLDEAIKQARRHGDNRLSYLTSHADEPERVLRTLSILDESDLEREFG